MLFISAKENKTILNGFSCIACIKAIVKTYKLNNKKVANFDLGVASNMNKEEFLVKHDFKIKTFDDVYKAVGIIIQISQYLEQEYRQYAKLINFEIKNLDSATLNKVNNYLHDNKKIADKDYQNLQLVIKERNYINHEFFWDKSFNNNLDLMNDRLNLIYQYICEGCDVVANLISKFNGCSTIRPTIFD